MDAIAEGVQEIEVGTAMTPLTLLLHPRAAHALHESAFWGEVIQGCRLACFFILVALVQFIRLIHSMLQ